MRMMRFHSKAKRLLLIFGVLILVVALFFLLTKRSASKSQVTLPEQPASTAWKSTNVNREFEFPILDTNGVEVSRFKYTLIAEELRDQIIVNGQTATAVNDRTFLIVTIKVTNPLDKNIQVNTRDYIRLIRNGNAGEQLAPDIHNDPVEIQAISTKYTRVGFPINKTDTNLQLQIGEIKGTKETVDIAL